MARHTESEALAKLMDLCQYSSAPALTAAEVDDILDRHVLAVAVVASTVYDVGDCVVPATANGYWYRIEPFPDSWTADGTGWSEPDDYPTMLHTYENGQVQGLAQAGALAIRCIGQEPEWLWDLESAAYEAWMAKVGKIAGTGSVKAGRLSIDNSGVREACLAQAARFAPKGFV